MASTSTCLEGTTKAMTLAHVNVPPAQTWNYLKIDQIALSVPVPTSAGTVPTRLPRLFSRIGAGVGTEAVSWVEATTGDSRYVEVPRGTVREEPIVLSCDADAGEVRDSGVMVRGGATATIVVTLVNGTTNASSSRTLTRELTRGSHTVQLDPGSFSAEDMGGRDGVWPDGSYHFDVAVTGVLIDGSESSPYHLISGSVAEGRTQTAECFPVHKVGRAALVKSVRSPWLPQRR